MMMAIDGAPGVGKSTIAAALEREGAYVVPEVNLLFARPKPEPADWYYDRQNARWEMAQLQSAQGRLAVLDGDPFQPVWLSWIYHNDRWWPVPAVIDFYGRRITDRRIAFPDVYILAHIEEPIRRERMLARERARGLGEERAQRKTLHYAAMVAPQYRYFNALGDRFPGWVVFLETQSIEASVAAIKAIEKPPKQPDSQQVLTFIADWLKAHPEGTD